MAELNKSIGLWQGTGMMLSIVLGAGLLALPGLAAQTAGGPGALAVWLACAGVSVPLLLVFAIIGRAHPDAGGIAAVMKKAFGRMGYAPATFLFFGAVAVGLPSIAIVGGNYASEAFGISPYLAAALLIAGATGVNLLSSRLANRMSAGLASAVILVLVLLALLGWQATQPSWSLVASVELPRMSVFGTTFMMVFFAFTGWEVAANLAGEFRNPERDFPLAMAMSFGLAVILYLVLALIVAAAGPGAATEAPFSVVLSEGYGDFAGQLVSIIAIVLIFANLSAAVWAVSRMVFSAAQERLIVRRLARTAGGVPTCAVVVTSSILMMVTLLAFAGLLGLEELLSAAGMNFLLLYAGAAAALTKLTTMRSLRVLGIASILVVAVLTYMRGVEHMVYPSILLCCGICSVISQIRVASARTEAVMSGEVS